MVGWGVEGHPLFDLRMVWLGGGWRVTLFLICGWCGWVGGVEGHPLFDLLMVWLGRGVGGESPSFVYGSWRWDAGRFTHDAFRIKLSSLSISSARP